MPLIRLLVWSQIRYKNTLLLSVSLEETFFYTEDLHNFKSIEKRRRKIDSILALFDSFL